MIVSRAVLTSAVQGGTAFHIPEDNVIYGIITKITGEKIAANSVVKIPAKTFAKIAVECFKTSEIEMWILEQLRQIMLTGEDVLYHVGDIIKPDPEIKVLQQATDALWERTPDGLQRALSLLGEAQPMVATRAATLTPSVNTIESVSIQQTHT